MYTVAGSTGNVGSAVADYLLRQGANVRVVVRNSDRAKHWAERGAEVVEADFDQPAHMAEAIRGSRGFFALLPMDLSTDDFHRRSRVQVDSIAKAVAGSEVPHVVLLSSGGAHRSDKNGPISALHHLENALRHDTAAVVTALRPGHFQEKVRDVLEVARHQKIYPVFADSAQRQIPMVATRDIGVEAAKALLAEPGTSETIDLVGPSYTETQVAQALGEQLGHALTVATIPSSERADLLQQQGMSAHIAELLTELYAADDAGLLDPCGDRAIPVTTPIETTISRILKG